MTSKLLGKFVRYRTLINLVARQPITAIRSWRSIKVFLKSANVGSNRKKVLIRFADLSNIFSVIKEDLPVLELGSGSSTLFFLANPRVTSLTTFEEKPEYLPLPHDKLSNKWHVVTNSFFIEQVDSLPVIRFKDLDNYLAERNFIYLDGPSTPVNPITKKVIPNKEILLVKDLNKHIVLVDGRQETVSILEKKLQDSHIFFPSMAYKKSKPTLSSLRLDLPKVWKQCLANNVRTSTFMPKDLAV